jgi:hypothetical protein
LNETSGKLIFSPTSGFVGEGNGKSELVLANAWAVGVSQQAKAPDNMEVGGEKIQRVLFFYFLFFTK